MAGAPDPGGGLGLGWTNPARTTAEDMGVPWGSFLRLRSPGSPQLPMCTHCRCPGSEGGPSAEREHGQPALDLGHWSQIAGASLCPVLPRCSVRTP